ncbi:MAG: hypothetical protein ACFLMY_07935 [Candidatus Brachytrichaceae bacterium NZ_4S206]|jgi:hypothetical protein
MLEPLYFTEADLAANQKGKLTPQQAQEAGRAIRRQQRTALIGMILAHLFMIGAFVWGMNRDASLYEAADQSARDLRTYFLIATQVIILFGYVHVIVIRPRLKKWEYCNWPAASSAKRSNNTKPSRITKSLSARPAS